MLKTTIYLLIGIPAALFILWNLHLSLASYKPCPTQPVIHKHVVKPLKPLTRQEYFQERIYQDFCDKEDLNFELCQSFIEHN
jgi:hypothetical protein